MFQNSFSADLPVADPGFSPGGAPTPKSAIIFQFFAENCMKMKEFGPPGGARVPGAPPWIRQCLRPLFVHIVAFSYCYTYLFLDSGIYSASSHRIIENAVI